jgi:methyl-accepting chemotaxis protein
LLKENYEFVANHIALIRTNYEQASLAYSGAVQNAHDYNESIEQKVKALDASLKVLNTTNTNVSEIAEVVKERYEKIEHLITNINEMSTAIATLQKLESQLNKINQKVA